MLLDRTDLPLEVRQELEDPRFINRTHYKRNTYDAGCSGPLCRKANREWMRIISMRRAHRKGKLYKPNPRRRASLAGVIPEAVLDEIGKQYLLERGPSKFSNIGISVSVSTTPESEKAVI